MKLVACAAALVVGVSPASAGPDAHMQNRYCAGMNIESTLPDTTRADCISDTHAIEVEFTEYWAQALGQALHYALWTKEISEAPKDFPSWTRLINGPRKAGIILVCRKAQDTCSDHYVRLYRVIQEFRLPVTIWDCDHEDDLTLDACQVIDSPD